MDDKERSGHQSVSILERARLFTSRVTKAVGYGVAGAAIGAGIGFTIKSRRLLTEEVTDQELLDKRISNVRFMQMARQCLPVLEGLINEAEYQDRRRLESEGYYPCSRCGVPHEGGGDDSLCDMEGTYVTEEGVKVTPEDLEWTPDGYEQATGKKWKGPYRDGGGTVH